MTRLADYLAMGGYGQFIWPAYAVAALVLVALAFAALRGYRARQAELREIEGAGARPAPDRREGT